MLKAANTIIIISPANKNKKKPYLTEKVIKISKYDVNTMKK